MIRALSIIIGLAFLVGVASAQISIGPDTFNNQKIMPFGRGSFAPFGPGSVIGGSGPPPPPSCTNKLDFSVACNSQYTGIF